LTSGLRARIVQILRLATPPRAAGAIILLGLAAATLEGAGLHLFMPFVGTFSSGAVSGGMANHLVNQVLAPAPHRLWTALVVAALCLSIAARFAATPQRQARFINPLSAIFRDMAFSRLKGRTRKLAFATAAPLAAIGYAAHGAWTRGAETAAAWIR
jgi:hypothetical protein